MPTATRHDPYEVLGVGRDASSESIKRAYRKQAVRFHPDRNPGDREAEESFKRAAEAYGILGDADKRARFDRFGHAGLGGAAGGPVNQEIFRDFEDLFGGGSVFDLFGQMFGGGPSRGPRRGNDLQYELHLDFADPRRDQNKRIRISRAEACDECRGSGVQAGTSARACPRCGGRGQVQVRRGFVVMSHPCGGCRGNGRIVDHPCRECGGDGQADRRRDINVRLPAGVDDGNQLRVPGEGEAGRNGGPPGDLFVLVHIRPDRRLRRDGATVHSTETISFPQAALGTRIEVDTIWGPEALTVPPGTQPGVELRLAHRGFPVLRRGSRGDHRVRIEVEVPRSLTPAARRAVEDLAGVLDPESANGGDESAEGGERGSLFGRLFS